MSRDNLNTQAAFDHELAMMRAQYDAAISEKEVAHAESLKQFSDSILMLMAKNNRCVCV